MLNIELKNISKIFDNSNVAVDNVSFKAMRGEFVVLVGPSGCGKSTILRMIAGLEDISSGELFFDDEIVNNLPPKDRNIGMVFQNYALYPHLTVFDNIAFPLSIRKINKVEIKKSVANVAEILNLTEFLNRKPKQLSGGQRQRVALGRAIVRSPKIFLFDEPLSNLDARLRISMRSEITSLQRRTGSTAIYVTHDQTEAMTMGTKIVVLDKGKIQQIGSPDEIYHNPANKFVASFVGNPQINFFEGKIIDGNFIDNYNKIELKNHQTIKINKINNITLGIRPENIYLDNAGNSNDFKVINIENLGNEFLYYFDYFGQTKAFRNIQNLHLSIGESVSLKFEDDKSLFFKD
ncbi:MAG: ABC transporter ATP-binding protein [Candidatus Kapabacteria bacterium]|nr:ABC transporter ATP-binding protein [Candidatus Kapabacteria bacterium]